MSNPICSEIDSKPTQNLENLNLKNNDRKIEPILQDTGRIATVPVDPRYLKILDLFREQAANFWVAERIKLHEDVQNYSSMPIEVQKSYNIVFGFFAASDEIVKDCLQQYFLNEIKVPEICCMYTFQAAMENEHSFVYNNIINEVIPDSKVREQLRQAVTTSEPIKIKADWAKRWFNSKTSFAHRVVACACVEGIMFQSSFAFIQWLEEQKYKMRGTTESNDYIRRDEGKHTIGAGAVYAHIVNKLSRGEAKTILDSAIEAETVYVKAMLPNGGFTGMTTEATIAHVVHVANLVGNLLGYSQLYGTTSTPLTFASKIDLATKGNFFEVEVAEYTPFDTRSSKKTDKYRLPTTGDF